jgi:ADP-ribose pyrophosphatase
MPIVYEGRVFSVEAARRRFPNGEEHAVEIVHHAPSVVLIPVQGDGRVIIIKQYRAPLDRETWEFPAGRVNPRERADDAARRECEEEVGLVPHSLEQVAALYSTPGFCDEQMIFFLASDLRTPPPDSTHKPDPDEDIETRIVTVTDVRKMVAQGEIVDLKTAYAVTLLGT